VTAIKVTERRCPNCSIVSATFSLTIPTLTDAESAPYVANNTTQRPPSAERWLRQCSNAGRRSSSAGMPTSWSQARGAIVGAVRAAAAVKHLAACESVSAQVPLQAPLSKTISTSYDAIRHDYATDNARSESGPASSLVYRIHGCQQQDVSHRKQIARQHSSR